MAFQTNGRTREMRGVGQHIKDICRQFNIGKVARCWCDVSAFNQLVYVLTLSVFVLAPQSAAAEDSGTSNRDVFTLGAQTHFAQGWRLEYLRTFAGIGVSHFRDEFNWSAIEQEEGVYDFTPVAPYMTAAEKAGYSPLIVFVDTNDLYDDGNTPYTDAGRAAYARYIAAAIQAFPNTIKRIEIGNEYNSDFARGPFVDRRGYFTGLMIKAIVPVVKEANPDMTVLCTGAHSVATGYLREVFETGALEYCDGISFHPYRSHPEHVDAEIIRLKSLMAEFGVEKPLHVTEFGNWFEDPADAPDYMLKMVALLGAVGVADAYWYALLNEEWWPNMGLFKVNGEEMPAAAAFRFLQTTLLPMGRPVARSARGEDHVYEFGDGGRAFIAWGAAPARLNVKGDATYFDTMGNQIDPVDDLTSEPVVIIGQDLSVEVVRDQSVHSAFFGYGAAPWSYLARKPDGEEVPFRVMDWNWGPYNGDP